MVFECQRNSYKKKHTTVVESCSPAELKTADEGISKQGYNVFLKDTILFPEGGGQPDDRGTINGIPVHRVTRIGEQACHFTNEPLEVDATVEIEVNWERRFDHMQQHSGQHLITAIIDTLYGFNTLSWSLGKNVSYIELNTSTINIDQIQQAEIIINDKITAGTPVITTVCKDASDPALKNVRTRGLPDDHKGQVRIITIEGVESNMCCGTHVSNLQDLQVVKLLYAEKMKKGKTNLYFAVGKRVIAYLNSCVERERKLMNLLKSNPEESLSLVEKLQKSLKLTQKNHLSTMRDLAILEGQKFKQIQPRPDHLFLHRRDAEAEFMMRVVTEINDPAVTCLISVGEDKGPGQIILVGPNDVLDEISPKICDLLGGKGFCKDGKFQAKVTNLSKRNVIEKHITDCLLTRKMKNNEISC